MGRPAATTIADPAWAGNGATRVDTSTVQPRARGERCGARRARCSNVAAAAGGDLAPRQFARAGGRCRAEGYDSALLTAPQPRHVRPTCAVVSVCPRPGGIERNAHVAPTSGHVGQGAAPPRRRLRLRKRRRRAAARRPAHVLLTW